MGTSRRRPTGKLADLTGPGITDRWGMTCADLGASVCAPNGMVVSVFGDTFSGTKVGDGDWRSPVILIGTGDATHPISYQRAGGDDPDYARQLWHYVHHTSGSARRGISTVIPSDLLRVGESLYLHAIVNSGFGNVVWTEIWSSADSGISWRHLGNRAKFPAQLHHGYAQCWSWDYDPDDNWVYVVSTGFQRDKGIILRRVRPSGIADARQYSGWGAANGRWSWGQDPTPLTPHDETWGELSLRRLPDGKWILGGFLSSHYALGYRVLDSPPRCTTRHSNGRSSARRGRLRTTPSTGSRNCTADTFFPARDSICPGCGSCGLAVEHLARLAVSGDAISGDAS
ncbi:hypothetical protein I553_8447 [Mycobacterium xenopi 4042]|uniref:DUF4185 domain-containing protein n=1 Tax=Mycobacterium xenopi 4042 TaxID=1299334 RepID=X8CJX9_MYCXE|nr:hypothetical protein I553_8447 [Mycobacterium xenopi 4042]